jgi:hypothetical protein
MDKELDKFRNTDLKIWKYAQLFFLLSLYSNILITSKLYSGLIFLGPIHLVGLLITSTYIYRQELKFIKNYDLKCNPGPVTKAFMAIKSSSLYATVVGGATLGSLAILDGFFEKY